MFALSTIGLAFVLYLGWASYFVLKVFCILCALTYVAVIALFIVSGGATTIPMTSLPRRLGRDVKSLVTSPVALVVLLLLVLGLGPIGDMACRIALHKGYNELIFLGDVVTFPQNGFGTSTARIQTTAPRSKRGSRCFTRTAR